jgi:hypothetical protein
MKLSMYILASETISTAHLYNSLPQICVSVCPLSLLDNGSVKKRYRCNEYTRKKKEQLLDA